MKVPICKKCRTEMFINEWNGWRFECGSCCATGRLATDLEIKELEDSQK